MESLGGIARSQASAWGVNDLVHRITPVSNPLKNTAALADGYVTGIEPGSGYPFNRRIERHFGRVPVLRTGESQVFDLNYKFLENESAVISAIERIEGIRDGRRPKCFHHHQNCLILNEWGEENLFGTNFATSGLANIGIPSPGH